MPMSALQESSKESGLHNHKFSAPLPTHANAINKEAGGIGATHTFRKAFINGCLDNSTCLTSQFQETSSKTIRKLEPKKAHSNPEKNDCALGKHIRSNKNKGATGVDATSTKKTETGHFL